jgi:hypothetical protein
MPDAGTMAPSVLFFVRVAADELILDSDIALVLLSSGHSLVISQATQGLM